MDCSIFKLANAKAEEDILEEIDLNEADSNFNRYDVIVHTTDVIPQLDGMDDLSDSSDRIEHGEPSKTVFGINCEHREIVQLVNFFRSFNVLWLSSQDHILCWLDEECFFCNLRSMFLRLRQERIKGPFLLKLNEFVCNMKKYEDILDYTLLDNLLEIEQNIENTLRLIFRFRKASPFFSTTLIDCEECSSNLDKFVLDIVLDNRQRNQILSLDELLSLSVKSRDQKGECCKDKIKLEYFEEKYVIVILSHVSSVDISDKKNISGYQISYRSHMEMKYLVGEQAFFRFDGQVFTK